MFSLKPMWHKFVSCCHKTYWWLLFLAAYFDRRRVLLIGLLILCAGVFYGLGFVNARSPYWEFKNEMDRIAVSVGMDLHGDSWSDRVLFLQQQLATSQQTNKQLTAYLNEKESEIESLNRQLHFYRQVIAPEDKLRGRLAIFSVQLKPALVNGHYPFEVVVRKSIKEKTLSKGKMLVHAEGLNAEKTAVYHDNVSAPLPFAFRYFQRLQGLIKLPAGFDPQTIYVILVVNGREKLKESYVWQALLDQHERPKETVMTESP